MHYSLFLLPVIAISHAAPLAPRQYSQNLAPQLIEQIRSLGAATKQLTTAVNNYDGSLFGVLPQGIAVISAEKKVDGLTLEATDTAQESSKFVASDSTEVVQTLATQIGPTQDSLNALKTKVCIAVCDGELALTNMMQYPEFKRTLTAPIVLNDLKTLKEHTGGLVAAVKEKVTAQDAGLLDFGKGILDQAFDQAIAVYS
jgi:hypothetical protein